ncbi:MAG: Maf family protein [Muribaculaceae bacterium]|nr:Maf family protein [Muribaculaceae bacterium]
MYKPLTNKKIYLASASPRRRQLLTNLDVEVSLIPPREVDESYPDDLPPEHVAEYVSRKKADAYTHDIEPGCVVITADTVVICDNEVLGKPHGGAEGARQMLRRLSGKEHKVVTGVTLTTYEHGMTSFSTTTRVWFKPLTDEEIDYYVSKYSPTDKAGAYGIQEWIGYIGIPRIEGDYYNVMGLPLHDLFMMLSTLN